MDTETMNKLRNREEQKLHADASAYSFSDETKMMLYSSITVLLSSFALLPRMALGFVPFWSHAGQRFPPLADQQEHHYLSTHVNHQEQNGNILVSDEHLDHDYVVPDTAKTHSSGTAQVHEAFRKCEATGQGVGDNVMIKMSPNVNAMKREVENTERVSEQDDENVIINILDHNIPPGPDDCSPDTCMIVMEKGCEDLVSYMNENSDMMTGGKLRNTIYSIVSGIDSIHASGLVWCDAKLSNFVVQQNGNIVKAIDLESCVTPGSQPRKFTPSTCPPEFLYIIEACLRGEPESVRHCVDHSFDIWSIGIIAFTLITRQSFFHDNLDPICVVDTLASIDQHAIDYDERLNGDGMQVDLLAKDFILKCLKVNPSERPSTRQLLQHPFLL